MAGESKAEYDKVSETWPEMYFFEVIERIIRHNGAEYDYNLLGELREDYVI